MKCRKCGMTIEKGMLNCTNCGTFVRKTNHPLGYAGTILAAVSILYNPWGFLSALAIVLSVIGLIVSIKMNRLKAFSIAGLSIGIVSLVWYIIVTILD